jgi:hypothetical protein
LHLCERHGGQTPEIGLAGALEVTLLVEILNRFLRRIAFREVVMERQLTDTRDECFDRFRLILSMSGSTQLFSNRGFSPV